MLKNSRLVLVMLVLALTFSGGIGLAQDSSDVNPANQGETEFIQLTETDAELIQLGDIVIGEGRIMEGDVLTLKGNITIAGTVKGDVVTILGNVTLLETAQVNGDVMVGKGQIIKEEGALVRGNLITWGGQVISFPVKDSPKADNMPRIERITRIGEGYKPTNINVGYRGPGLFPSVLQFFGMLGLAVLAVSIFPGYLSRMASEVNQDFPRNFLVGLAGWIIYPFVMLVFVLTIIGIPVAIFMGLMIPVIFIVGILVTAIAFGNGSIREMLSNIFPWAKEPNILIGGVIGVTVLWLVAKAPFIGWVVMPVVAILGLGTILTTKFGTNKPWFKPRGPGTRNNPDVDSLNKVDILKKKDGDISNKYIEEAGESENNIEQKK